MKLINSNPDTGSIRWAYDADDSIVKVVPFVASPSANINDQINIINSLHSKKLIHDDWKLIEKPEHNWVVGKLSSNTYIQYRMIKVPYVFELDKNIPYAESKQIPLSPIYTNMDLYNEHILSKYIETNIKIFPYMNTDGGHGNILQFDINDWIIVDWDDCILGNEHDSQRISSDLISEAVEAVTELGSNFTYNDLLENYKKTFDFYKKLTYNTVLESFEADLSTMASASYKKLDSRRTING